MHFLHKARQYYRQLTYRKFGFLTEAAFYTPDGQSNLLSIKLPNTVQSIGANAFSNCKQLQRVVIGSGIESIAPAFYDCNSLSNLCVYSKNPPSLPFNVEDEILVGFPGCNVYVYVPKDSVEIYMTAEGWRECSNSGYWKIFGF